MHHHHHQQFLHFFLTTLLTLIPSSISQPQCPLNFQILPPLTLTTPATCQYILQLIRLLQSDYLSHTNSFSPPDNFSDSCWRSYESVLHDETIPTRCGFRFPWISSDCMNVTTRAQFESRVASNDSLTDVVSACNQSLLENSPCASCTTALSSLSSVCTEFSVIYAGAFVNRFGPTDVGTARCLFNLDFTPNLNRTNRRNIVVIIVAVVVCVLVLVICLLVFFVIRRRKFNRIRIRRIDESRERVGSGLDSISGSTTLVRYTFEEVKIATRRFSRENMIGKGGYGNVYKGTLEDGTEVAFKRFKNCSVAGDASFTHEVEVIASVRHVNLVGLRGYCTETMALEGYQRIIVCELMRNGSVHDHLFGGVGSKLSWDVRRRIAVGTARGLAYLHYGAQPAIIHRDIKGSNILLDDKFEPKLADFGLAKFTPEGMTHLSTRVAGTMGYVAPEYALYGQVTERSDVYSFGIVLLELLSGKKALMAVGDGHPLLVADWAWSLVRKGKAMEVIEDGMADLGPFEVVEKYVLVAVLCSHPQPYARPTMDQVVKMLDMDVPVPVIPERPISIISSIDDIERSVSSSGSGHFSTSAGYQPYLIEQERGMTQKEDNGNFGDR